MKFMFISCFYATVVNIPCMHSSRKFIIEFLNADAHKIPPIDFYTAIIVLQLCHKHTIYMDLAHMKHINLAMNCSISVMKILIEIGSGYEVAAKVGPSLGKRGKQNFNPSMDK